MEEQKQVKVYLVQGMLEYANWIPNHIITNDLEEADIVLFEGGSDVDPSIYGQPKHPRTYSNIGRDNYEVPIYKKAVELGKNILGICRGSQLSCVMAGGILVQDQPNPNYIHSIKTYDDKVINITSTHHQAQYPFNLPEEDYKILGWTENMLEYHEGGNREKLNPKVECEIVYYTKTNCLAIQGHPELLFSSYTNKPKEGYEDTIEWLQDLLKKFLNKEL